MHGNSLPMVTKLKISLLHLSIVESETPLRMVVIIDGWSRGPLHYLWGSKSFRSLPCDMKSEHSEPACNAAWISFKDDPSSVKLSRRLKNVILMIRGNGWAHTMMRVDCLVEPSLQHDYHKYGQGPSLTNSTSQMPRPSHRGLAATSLLLYATLSYRSS